METSSTFVRLPKLGFGIAIMMLLAAPTVLANTTDFSQTNLVSDMSGLAASTDPNLKNPWGIAFSPTSPFWVSDQMTNVSTLYQGDGTIVPLVVSVPGGPTGAVFTGGLGFSGSPAFAFDTLSGSIATWAGGSSATTVVSTAGAVYTGLTIANSGGANYLFAADSNGSIDVFDSNFNNVTHSTFAGKFVDPSALAGFNPFNVQAIGSDIYVTYAQLGPGGTALPGGYVDEFSSSGNFIMRLATGGALYAPWGITLAPAGFGSFGGDILVGNFGNGEIDAYTPGGTFVGALDNSMGMPIINSNLWSLDFRTGAGFNPDALYFDAGIDNQKDGLFGSISPVASPEPSSIVFLTIGLFGLLVSRKARRKCSSAGAAVLSPWFFGSRVAQPQSLDL